MTMTAAIYARFSTDRQRETSIDDQARVCQTRATALGLGEGRLYHDEGVSGSTPVARRRDGAQLLADALAGRFSVLLVEGLDRLSRDMVEQERIVRRLEYRGIRIIGVADGYDSEGSGRKIQRAMRGIINEVYLDDLRHKTHRGLVGQLARGGHAGGGPYGYRSVLVEGVYVLEVEAAQADVVRWIFARYGEGWSCQRIAADLNARGGRTRRGTTWSVSTLYGCPTKGSGVLNNELYIGRLVWNRSQWLKDPDTGKRTRFVRPREEWIIEDHPELRIIDEETWAAVRARFKRPGRTGGSAGKGKRPSTLFGGMIRCGKCGGVVIAISRTYYGCAQRKDRGTSVCTGLTARRVIVDSKLVGQIRADLLSPVALAEFQSVMRELLADRRRTVEADQGAIRAEMAGVEQQIERLVDAISQGGFSAALADRLASVERQRDALKQREALASASACVDVSNLVARWRQMAFELERAMQSDIARARELIRPLMEGAVLVEDGGQRWIEIEKGRAAVAVGLTLGLVAGAIIQKLRKTIAIAGDILSECVAYTVMYTVMCTIKCPRKHPGCLNFGHSVDAVPGKHSPPHRTELSTKIVDKQGQPAGPLIGWHRWRGRSGSHLSPARRRRVSGAVCWSGADTGRSG
jgi:DNA invertase Pin-like site-specific DNA recombinase